MEPDEWVETSGRDDFGPAPEAADCSTEESERLLPSLAFWFCLSAAAAIFAVVFLSPRLRTYRDLRRQYDGLERGSIASETNVDYLNRVVEALKHDPDFAAELARPISALSDPKNALPSRRASPQRLRTTSTPRLPSSSTVFTKPARHADAGFALR